MHQRDYILRLIEQLGSVLAELRRRITGRRSDPAQVDAELASVAGRAGMDLELLRGFSEETLHMFVSPTGEIEPARCWLMAELLYLDALQASLQDSAASATDGFRKARMLFTLVEPGGGMLLGFPEAAERIAEIDGHLNELGGSDPSA